MGLCFFYSCSLSRLGFDLRGEYVLPASSLPRGGGQRGGRGLVVGYMQINSLGAGWDCGSGTGGAVYITVRATTASFRISSSILSMPICASLSHSLTRFSLLLHSHCRSESDFGLARSVFAPHASITS